MWPSSDDDGPPRRCESFLPCPFYSFHDPFAFVRLPPAPISTLLDIPFRPAPWHTFLYLSHIFFLLFCPKPFCSTAELLALFTGSGREAVYGMYGCVVAALSSLNPSFSDLVHPPIVFRRPDFAVRSSFLSFLQRKRCR